MFCERVADMFFINETAKLPESIIYFKCCIYNHYYMIIFSFRVFKCYNVVVFCLFWMWYVGPVKSTPLSVDRMFVSTYIGPAKEAAISPGHKTPGVHFHKETSGSRIHNGP